MPNMNGDDATAILRQRGIKLPIVGVTGDAQREDIEAFMCKGANEVLSASREPLSLGD